MSKTDLSLYFANPTTPDHRKYEVLRALFLEKLPQKEVSEKFGYTNYLDFVTLILKSFAKPSGIHIFTKKINAKR